MCLIKKVYIKWAFFRHELQCCGGEFSVYESTIHINYNILKHQFSSVQSLSFVRLFATPWVAARDSITCPPPSPGVHPNSRPLSPWCHPAISSSVVPFSSCTQSLPASVFSNESTLRMRWPKYWSFIFSIIPSKEIPGLISFRMDWLDQSKGLSKVFSNTTVQKHQFFSAQPSSQSNSHIHTWPQENP